jgi:uncharacterized protein (DUF1330 family)
MVPASPPGPSFPQADQSRLRPPPARVVIIEFPDIASIKNWYRAPEYQPLIALRRSAATDVMIMVEGL